MSVTVKKNPARVATCCRKSDPFQSPRVGSYLTLGNEDKARDFIGKKHLGGEQYGREPRRTALPHAHSLGFYGNGISFWVVFGQSF